MPYITGGLGADWAEAIRAAAAAGADAIEIGIPFSDPVMDGPVIQEASASRRWRPGPRRSASSTTWRGLDAGIPLAVMTYYNIVFRTGHERFAQTSLAAAGWPRRSCPTCRSRRSGRGPRPPTPPGSRR